VQRVFSNYKDLQKVISFLSHLNFNWKKFPIFEQNETGYIVYLKVKNFRLLRGAFFVSSYKKRDPITST